MSSFAYPSDQGSGFILMNARCLERLQECGRYEWNASRSTEHDTNGAPFAMAPGSPPGDLTDLPLHEPEPAVPPWMRADDEESEASGGSGRRLPVADLPEDDASMRVRDWVAEAHGTPTGSAREEPLMRMSHDACEGLSPLRRGRRGRSGRHSFADVYSGDIGGVTSRSESEEEGGAHGPYGGALHELEESRHEGELFYEAPAIDGEADGAIGAEEVRLDETEPTSSPAHAQAKHKHKPPAPARPWLRIGDNGELSKLTTTSKYKAAHKLGVKPRDLRFLELPVRSMRACSCCAACLHRNAAGGGTNTHAKQKACRHTYKR